MLKGLICALFLTATAFAGEWEVGAIGGVGYSPSLTVSNGSQSANTGLKNGLAVGVFAGEDMYKYFSGEANYLYREGDFKLESGSTKVAFGGHTHLITGDFLAHFTPRGSRIRPFISFGGGIEVMEGTGIESASQPLGNLAALTATQEVVPVGEVGAGVKFELTKHLRLRVQVRDYLSKAPNEVIAPAPGASLSGILNDVVGTAAISLTW